MCHSEFEIYVCILEGKKSSKFYLESEAQWWRERGQDASVVMTCHEQAQACKEIFNFSQTHYDLHFEILFVLRRLELDNYRVGCPSSTFPSFLFP